MRAPKEYIAKDGTSTWRVRYRDAGGHDRSRTFIDQENAAWFAGEIEARGLRFALKALADLEAEDREADTPALDAVAEEFLTWKADYVRSSRTVPDYRRDYTAYLKPTLGHVPVGDITSETVSEWVDRMVTGRIVSVRTGAKLSPKSIRDHHALLHQILDYAANPRRGYIDGNPCTSIDNLPKRIKPAPKGLMPAEWQALYAALRQIDEHAAALATFLLGTGWRWGEASALPIAAVEDYGDGQMWVTMMQVNRRGDASHFAIVQDEGKSQNALRRIRVDAEVAAMLRARIARRAPADLVFTRDGENPWTYQRFEKIFQRAVSAANLSRRPTIHWLRHTHVAWLAMSGAALPQLQNRVGHESIETTIGTYGRMIGDVGDDTLAKFAQIRSSRPKQQQRQIGD